MGLDLGFPARTIRGAAIRATRGCRSSRPASPRSATRRPGARSTGTSHASFNTNLTKVAASTTSRPGIAGPPEAGRLAAERANPRGSFTFATNATRTFGTGSQTGNFYNQYAAFLLGLVGTAARLSVRALHRQRVAARAVLPRPVDAEPEAHAGSGPAVGVLPGHAPRRSGDRDARSEHARRADRRPGRQPEEHGSRGAEGRVSRRGSARSTA